MTNAMKKILVILCLMRSSALGQSQGIQRFDSMMEGLLAKYEVCPPDDLLKEIK